VSLFDQLVNQALRARADLSSLRPVVEKELLHHDILREMSAAGLLAGLTFIGGTCLRACYRAARKSSPTSSSHSHSAKTGSKTAICGTSAGSSSRASNSRSHSSRSRSAVTSESRPVSLRHSRPGSRRSAGSPPCVPIS
jgi:hypothetical protein